MRTTVSNSTNIQCKFIEVKPKQRIILATKYQPIYHFEEKLTL